MPELSRFYGITIRMHTADHNPPHFHAEVGEHEAIFNIIDGVFMKGYLPSKEARLVLAWYEIHKEELINNWNNLTEGKPHTKILPLK